MNSKILKIAVALWVLVCLSCEKEANWESKNNQKDYIIVNSIITNELAYQWVRLSKPIEQLNEEPKMVSGAEVKIEVGDSIYTLEEDDLTPGLYKSTSQFIGVIGKTYKLGIESNNKKYSAKTHMVGVTPNPPLKFHVLEKNTGEVTYFQLDENNAEFSNESFVREIYLDWSGVTGFENVKDSLTRALVYNYSFNSIGVNQIFSPEKKRVIFPKGTLIKVKKYSLTRAHSKYLRAVLSETQWKGGYFDQFSANPPTNLSEGALGFFGASSVVVDSIIAK